MSRAGVIIGGLVLAAGLGAAAVLTDATFNDGRILSVLMGRDRLVAACLPELKKNLAQDGYEPTDIEIVPEPSIGLDFGRSGKLAGRFTFADGPGESRIDGIMACLVVGPAVHVDFRATALPRRAA
jgi:hypothetical protein